MENKKMSQPRDILTREGEIGEMSVSLNLTKLGHVVSVPMTASTNGYDLLVDATSGVNEGKILKIQVKSCKPSPNGMVTVPLINRRNSSVAKNNRGQIHRYSEITDYIALHVKGDDEIYYIPSGELPTDKTSETFLLPRYSGSSSKERLTDKWRKLS